MRSILLGLLAVAGIAIATPVVPSASAQVIIETPGGGVRVGPDRDRDYYRRRYDDRDYDRRGYDRDRYHGCRTVTIRRDDGSVRRTRRCDYISPTHHGSGLSAIQREGLGPRRGGTRGRADFGGLAARPVGHPSPDQN